MPENIEVRARIDLEQRKKILDWAEKFGTGLIKTAQQDTYFHAVQGRLKIRHDSKHPAELISYRRLDLPEPRLATYQRFSLDEPEQVHKMLADSVGVKCTVTKERSSFRIEQCRLCLDSVEELGEFVKLKIAVGQERSEEIGLEIISSLMDQLSLLTEQLIAGSYADLLLDSQGGEP